MPSALMPHFSLRRAGEVSIARLASAIKASTISASRAMISEAARYDIEFHQVPHSLYILCHFSSSLPADFIRRCRLYAFSIISIFTGYPHQRYYRASLFAGLSIYPPFEPHILILCLERRI